jgi:hypothetical protein
MQGLDHILNKTSHLLVLRVLYHAEGALTGREVQRRSGLSNRAAMLALEALNEVSVLRCESTAQANWYEVNTGNYFFAKAIKPAFECEDLFWDDFRKLVRRVVTPRPIAAVVTGPFARNENESSGKLELTMIFSTGRNRMRAFRCSDELADGVWDRYALNVDTNWIDTNCVDDEDFATLWRRIEREGVLLYGTLP